MMTFFDFQHIGRIRLLVMFFIAMGLTACATTAQQETAAPTRDEHAVKIIELVKEEPSTIHGGGMIYELFVGTRFNAKYNDLESKLTIIDLENESSCEFAADGMLMIPEDAIKGYAQYCNDLSANTFSFITE